MKNQQSLSGWDQLILLRDIANSAGALHDAQVRQLRIWPLALFSHVLKHEFQWDFEERRLFFRFKVHAKKKPPRNLEKRYKILDHNVKLMLGPEWSIEIKVGTKQVFASVGDPTALKKIADERKRKQSGASGDPPERWDGPSKDSV